MRYKIVRENEAHEFAETGETYDEAGKDALPVSNYLVKLQEATGACHGAVALPGA